MDIGSHKKIGLILLIVCICIGLGALTWYFTKNNGVTTTSKEQPSSFSPFNRPANTSMLGITDDIPYQQPQNTETQASTSQSQTSQTPINRVYTAPLNSFYEESGSYRGTFSLPSQQRTSETIVYSDPDSSNSTSLSPYYGYTYATSTDESGWTKLFGHISEEVHNGIYSSTTKVTSSSSSGGKGGSAADVAGGVGGFEGGGGSGLQNFGGKVTKVTYCTCSAAILLDLNDVRGKRVSVLHQMGASQLYAYYNIYSTGQYIKGDYTPGGTCQVYRGNNCSSEGNPDGTIRQIGTGPQ